MWSKSFRLKKTDDFNWNTNKIGSLVCAIFQNHGCETLPLTLTMWPWPLFFIKSYLNSQSHTTCNIRNGFLVTKIDFVLIVYARSDLDLGFEHVTLMSKYSNYLKKILNSSRNIYIDGEIIKSTNYSLKYAHCFSECWRDHHGNKPVQKYGGWDPRI